MRQHRGWFGVDFDGTLAIANEGAWDPAHLGEPVPAMVEQVKALLAEGHDVKIFTARVGATGKTNDAGELDGAEEAQRQRELIQAWCVKHLGVSLEVTATKDFQMLALFDDRAVQIIKNTGKPIVEDAATSLAAAERFYMSLKGCTLTGEARRQAELMRVAIGIPEEYKLTGDEIEEPTIVAPTGFPARKRFKRQ